MSTYHHNISGRSPSEIGHEKSIEANKNITICYFKSIFEEGLLTSGDGQWTPFYNAITAQVVETDQYSLLY